MAGFHLPKFKWLLIGAMAAGGWAMTQESPKREHWQHRQETADATPNKPAVAEKSRDASVRKASVPAEMTTSSIPRPEAGLANRFAKADGVEQAMRAAEPDAKAGKSSLWTTDKVRMRKEANTSSAVVTMLKGGQSVAVLDTEGTWKKVSVLGQTGWVRGDYLTEARPATSVQTAIPRPKADIGSVTAGETRTASISQTSGPAPMSEWDALRPARPPQGGDCQCPYDLMLNGKQCGGRSAYAQGRKSACYF